MDKTVPAGAAILLDFIGGIEAPQGYGTLYGNNQRVLPKPLVQMTVNEVIAAGPSWTKRFKSSAAGRYQFMNATLKGLRQQLRLGVGQVFDANLQDRLGYHLLKRRGYEQFMAGKIGLVEFGKRLAQEWASLPVLADTQGQERKVTRGQSYYAGDGLNKSLVEPAKVEAILAKAKAAGNGPVSAPPQDDIPHAPSRPDILVVDTHQDDASGGKWPSIIATVLIILIALAIAGAFFWR
ncbi:hypothetical protein [Devosia sp. 919]|uniref:hypothetical protein n=1 Tax=Devosia sp. 919 TaxID=2726065 RepID=UPI00155236D9|nr:hypothetical protein [Devosia sp. 919]